jgi:hypothetical protein
MTARSNESFTTHLKGTGVRSRPPQQHCSGNRISRLLHALGAGSCQCESWRALDRPAPSRMLASVLGSVDRDRDGALTGPVGRCSAAAVITGSLAGRCRAKLAQPPTSPWGLPVPMPTVAEWSRRTYPAPLGAGGVGSIPANSDAQTCLLSAVGD